ncbi:MAG: hypothetical protein ABIO44_00070 [Saprospiraceae bacterium]
MKKDWKDYLIEKNVYNNPVVPEYIWQNVKPHLPKPKSISRYFFWILSLLFLVIASIGMNFFVSTQLNKSNLNSSPIVNKYGSLENKNSLVNNSLNTPLETPSNPKENKLNTNLTNKTFVLNQNTNLKLRNSIQAQKNINNVDKIISKNTSTDIETIINSPINSSVERPANQKLKSLLTTTPSETNLLTLRDINSLKLQSTNPKVTLIASDCYSFSNKNRKSFFAEIYVGPMFAPYTLKATNPEKLALLNFRKTSESSQISSIAGLRLGMQINKFTIRTGIEFQSIYEQMHYNNSNYFDVIKVYKNDILIRLDTIYGKQIVKIHNYHNLFYLPISVGYDLRLGTGKITPQVGIGINLYSWHKGAVLDSVNLHRIFTTNKNTGFEIYKTQIGLSAFFNVQYLLPLYQRTNLFIEPGIQYYINPFNKNAYNIDQKYWSMNIKVGLKYNF